MAHDTHRLHECAGVAEPGTRTVSASLHAHGYDSDRLSASVTRILAANTLCSLATRNEAGTVHINTAFFCFGPDLLLYFLSHPKSVHCRNLAVVPQMAVGVFDSHQPWGDPHTGLQLFGTGTLANADASRQARELYAARFPRYREFLSRTPNGQPLSSTLGGLKFYRFLPQRGQILDEWEFGEEVFIPATIVPAG
jgi:uncharacterized protein YhbP (UPF0306 family)